MIIGENMEGEIVNIVFMNKIIISENIGLCLKIEYIYDFRSLSKHV